MNDEKLNKFKKLQEQMKILTDKVPPTITMRDYVKTVHYKKVIKATDKFLKLKPTDDDKAFIRMDNHLSDLKRFY